ncbi:MAG: glycosyltransferase [Nitrospira sp.]
MFFVVSLERRLLTYTDCNRILMQNSLDHFPLHHRVPSDGLGRPLLSAIVPCRNERRHIETCVRSLLAQERPQGGMEVIIVDGLSDDGTREILEELSKEHSELRVVENPRRVTPCAMNAGIREARGQYIAILGAHCDYASDYLRVCASLLKEHPEVGCVGGPIISVGKSLFGQAVAAAMSHPVGIGNARHRHPNFEGYAEGACFPVFRKEVFEKVGLYDEMLVRNQDDELNYRFTKQGGKVFLSPRARATYFVRETVTSLFRQYFEYGYWRVAVLRKHRVPASFRQIVPPLFMSLMAGSVIVGWLLPGWWKLLAGVLPVLYGTALLIAGLTQKGNRDWRVVLLFPVAASILHIAYAWGVLYGIVKGADRGSGNDPSDKGASFAAGA